MTNLFLDGAILQAFFYKHSILVPTTKPRCFKWCFLAGWDVEFPAKGDIFSQCPHEMLCARNFVETRDHPCNFSQNVELSFAQVRRGLFYNFQK